MFMEVFFEGGVFAEKAIAVCLVKKIINKIIRHSLTNEILVFDMVELVEK